MTFADGTGSSLLTSRPTASGDLCLNSLTDALTLIDRLVDN